MGPSGACEQRAPAVPPAVTPPLLGEPPEPIGLAQLLIWWIGADQDETVIHGLLHYVNRIS
jgi:hypothetical protein